jgi:hypothetical protein
MLEGEDAEHAEAGTELDADELFEQFKTAFDGEEFEVTKSDGGEEAA